MFVTVSFNAKVTWCIAHFNGNLYMDNMEVLPEFCSSQSKNAIRDIRSRMKAITLNVLYMVFALLGSTTLFAQVKLLGLTSDAYDNGTGSAFGISGTGSSFTIHNGFSKGEIAPHGDLIKAKDGNFYGMTHEGGNYGYGTIFKLTPSGITTILKSFDYNSTGRNPWGNLVQGMDGSLYGMTPEGGLYGYGSIFKITTTGTFTVLKHMDYDSTGGSCYGTLIQDPDSSFYGFGRIGGKYKVGTLFKITSKGSFTVIKHLTAKTGVDVRGKLLPVNDSTFYALAGGGGSNGNGSIFKITKSGNITVIKNFYEYTSGSEPYGTLVKGYDGNFYGMTSNGGPKSRQGVVFQLTSSGGYKVLKEFQFEITGSHPYGGLTLGADSALYGMTRHGGPFGAGTIFKITPSGTFTILKSLDRSPGCANYPWGSLLQASPGIFYGMAYRASGNQLGGAIFKITAAGAYTTLATLPNVHQGMYPQGGLIQANDGFFYGMARDGGARGFGTIFKLCTNNSLTTLFSFDDTSSGGHPYGDLMQASDGNFYGMTNDGGKNKVGTIFKFTPSGKLTVLRHLDTTSGTASTGYFPYGSLVQGSDSALYGMAYRGGRNDMGTIFRITTSGSFKVLKHLDAASGIAPYGSLTKALDGNFYGVTSDQGPYYGGTIFKITPSGSFTLVKKLDAASGYRAQGTLIQDKDSMFYGTTRNGGKYDAGVIFKMTPAGALTVLDSLDLYTTGGFSRSALVQDADGYLYGTTSSGGKYGGYESGGTIFRIHRWFGGINVLKHFNPQIDGGTPLGSLVIQKPTPKAVAQSLIAKEDSTKAVVLGGTGGAQLSYSVSTGPKNGTLSGSGINRVYKPKPNFYGRDSFYYKVTWGCQISSSAKVLITVTPVNDTPVLAPIGNKSVVEGSALAFTATATDVDAGQSKTYSLVGAPTGVTIGATSGVCSWTPKVTGTYTFKVRVTDNGVPALSDEEQISVTVKSSGPRIAQADGRNITPDQLLTISVAPNPTDNFFSVHIQSRNNKALNIIVTDAIGRIVERKKNVAFISNLQIGHGYKPGAYILQVEQGNARTYVKLVKQ
jgi:uncharacterized repeat protein (TIGR03803 family)